MKRETVIAISLGILLGVGIGFFVLFKSINGEQTKVIPVGDTEANKVVTTNATSAGQTILTIQEPVENVVVNKKDITIKGKAQPDSLIVIQSQVSNAVLKNEKEDFSIPFSLALGENTLSINAYSNSSNPQEIILKVYYVEE
ncbi:MAG TPA: hypothetical protein PLS49_03335 [Candidatus Woesebacteria bacterium]|nr:hypothetical protein [Candidatus Woesebacteria bacterium]